MFSCVQGNGVHERDSPSRSYVLCTRIEANISDLKNSFKILHEL